MCHDVKTGVRTVQIQSKSLSVISVRIERDPFTILLFFSFVLTKCLTVSLLSPSPPLCLFLRLPGSVTLHQWQQLAQPNLLCY